MRTFRGLLKFVAILAFIGLSLSPLYYRQTTNDETNDFNVVKAKLKQNYIFNITNQLGNDKYKCFNDRYIPIIEPDGIIIKVMHFSGPNCSYCVEEAQNWGEFPIELNTIIQARKLNTGNDIYDRLKIAIVHIMSIESSQSDNANEFINNLMGPSSIKAPSERTAVYESIAKSPIAVCVGTMQQDLISDMRITQIPYVIVTISTEIDDEVLYVHSGSMQKKEMREMANIIANAMTKYRR